MDYLFAYAVGKRREHGYGSLTEAEKWDWHGDVYGFRRVFAGANPDERTSPCDPFGRWFDEGRAALAEVYYRARLQGDRKQTPPDDSVMREAETARDKWARDRGYNDFDHYKQIEHLDHVDACVNVATNLLRGSVMANTREMHEKADIADREESLRRLGVTAREYTADEMRAGRIAVGLEAADAAE